MTNSLPFLQCNETGLKSNMLIQNADGKMWAIPTNCHRVSVEIYQPSSKRGKMLKYGLPFISRISRFLRIVGINIVQFKLIEPIDKLIKTFFHCCQYDISIFFGTPCIHQKVTLQISSGHTILGYLKLTDEPAIAQLFDRESLYLDRWKNINSMQLPKCLFVGQIPNTSLWGFLQTTKKTLHSTIPHHLNSDIVKIVKSFCRETINEYQFENTDFKKDLLVIEQNLSKFPFPYHEILYKGICLIQEKFQGKQVTFSGYHGDFTPWNCFWQSGALFVFDFEYARSNYPPLLDVYHFFFQTCFFEAKMNAQQILDRYTVCRLFRDFKDPNFLFICYLVNITGFYVLRDHGTAWKDRGCNAERVELLRLLLMKYENA